MTEYDPVAAAGRGARPRVAELFAGVGGFHLALDRAGFEVVWSNQWEPGTKVQHAFDCYERHILAGDFETQRDDSGPPRSDLGLIEHVAVNEDIAAVLDRYEAQLSGPKRPVFSVVPDVDLLVGGFPCQDYSVAKTLRQSHGIAGKKGVLWWEIHRLLRLKIKAGKPVKYLFLENVDRLIKSPSSQRGRDFAVMLSSLAYLGYEVEWRIVNAADYGFPQRRRRVFIVGRHAESLGRHPDAPDVQMTTSGVLARALPLQLKEPFDHAPIGLHRDAKDVTDLFGSEEGDDEFGQAGVMRLSRGRKRRPSVWVEAVTPVFDGERRTLESVLEADADVPPQFFVSEEDLPKWRYLKGSKSITRVSRATGHEYTYDEGAIPFPDHIDAPSRTILTGEGGATPSRFKHIIQRSIGGPFRRLTPRELECLNGFPPDWTLGMSDGKRAFMMGNALVVDLVKLVAKELAVDLVASSPPVESPEELPTT